ncbi:hypothetical protein [Rhodococcus sp. NPDC055024]
MSVDLRIQKVAAELQNSRLAATNGLEVKALRRAVTELAKIVETLLPEPEPTPDPVDAMCKQVDDRVQPKVHYWERGPWWQAQGSGSTVGARVTESHVNVQHPTVARIKFADGGVVGPSTAAAPGVSEATRFGALVGELTLRHNAELANKNDQIANLETRIFNQRRELAVLNGKQSENTQVMGWLAAIANADKDVEAGLAAGKALSEFAQTLRAA